MDMHDLSPSARKILNAIRIHSGRSPKELSKSEGFGLTKVFYILEHLTESGFLKRVKGAPSTGRTPSLFQLQEDVCFVLGIEIGTQHLRAVVCNANGLVVGSQRTYEPLGKSRRISIESLRTLCQKAIDSARIRWGDIAGIGLGMTGIVDGNAGKCLFLPNTPDWQNKPVVREVQAKMGIKDTFLLDSVHAMALSESRYGSGRSISNFILLNIGVGLGAGIFIDGRLLKGLHGITGEFGHIYIGESNSMCSCGNYGCIESVASGWALVRRAREAIAGGVVSALTKLTSGKKLIEISDVIDCAKEGDKLALKLIEETAQFLSIGASTLINLLNPQAITIAGGIAEGAGEMFIKPFIRETISKTLPWLQNDVDIRLSGLGEFSAARGAATLALDRIFHYTGTEI